MGNGDQYDVTLAKAALVAYRDAVANLDLAYQQALRSLEALAGRYPAAALVATIPLVPEPDRRATECCGHESWECRTTVRQH